MGKGFQGIMGIGRNTGVRALEDRPGAQVGNGLFGGVGHSYAIIDALYTGNFVGLFLRGNRRGIQGLLQALCAQIQGF